MRLRRAITLSCIHLAGRLLHFAEHFDPETALAEAGRRFRAARRRRLAAEGLGPAIPHRAHSPTFRIPAPVPWVAIQTLMPGRTVPEETQ